ncbi:hypothetical protein [Escherichia albertii]|uniref:hypothetical protein n=1 Tax=Escherichia albertii TaxID=208962 RepID=UPI0021D5055F|nr:hypothetical protein [Escherichia albertii]MCU7289368.1 hypothetical protein [Escherichia albertii]QTA14557.1 hypothetical protein FYK19_00840 [Escherichia albertii]WDB23734.1 hypothetical protein PS035_17975 [Escherichia albertii]WDC29073.1 hypothetical protein PS043_19670 [Escherichia albertii]HAX3030806.1 hypothetical protein [Escherichia albertii]
MEYYSGGYFLLHCLPLNHLHPQLNGKLLLTCSTCFNESLFGDWALSWTSHTDSLYDANTTIHEHINAAFAIDDSARERIHIWADKKFDEGKIGWIGVFMDAATAIEYKKTFFAGTDNTWLLALYFSEHDANRFLARYKNEGVPVKLATREREKSCANEQLLGYDIVGLDLGGEFHTSHCHNLHAELHQRFGLTLNEYGLYNNIPDWQPVVDYMNDEKTACEPVPWGIARIKQVIF